MNRRGFIGRFLGGAAAFFGAATVKSQLTVAPPTPPRPEDYEVVDPVLLESSFDLPETVTLNDGETTTLHWDTITYVNPVTGYEERVRLNRHPDIIPRSSWVAFNGVVYRYEPRTKLPPF